MNQNLKISCIFFLLLLSNLHFSQNEAKKWYFGNQAGLDFATSPPTVLTNGSMYANYSCASVANATGGLLFYTNGNIIYDQTHAAMANGTGLSGNTNGTNGSQGVIIIKKPGSSTIYYVFTTSWVSSNNSGLYYSEVDMSLAAGNGSVTVKNTVLVAPTGTSSIGKLTATRHCNGNDIWLVARDWYYNNTSSTGTITVNNSFRSFLISSTGVNTTAVVSTPAAYTYTNNWGWSWDYGCMKISPNGKKLGVALYNWNNWSSTNNNNSFEMFDYDNTTGVVSNSLALMTNTNSSTTWDYAWGCEFSPDGTKFYGSKYVSWNNSNGGVFQWDLCAGSPTAVVASIYTVYPSPSNTNYFGSLQLAPDGKIYCSRWNLSSIDVINNPNLAGSACGYTLGGQSVSPKLSLLSLPNFMGSHFIQRPPPTPFTHTVSNTYGCQAALFNSTYNPSITTVGCSASGYSLTNLSWNFGDPASGSANTSTLVSPIHAFTNLGTYSVSLILYYSCGGGTDTLKQVVNINQPCISVTSTSITCANLGSATVAATGGIGPFSYTWMPTAQTSSVASGLSPGTYTLTVFDFGNNFTYTATTVFTSLIPLTGNLNNSPSVTCHGASTATANVTNIAGGSGVENYIWFNGTTTYTSSTPLLSAGLWSVTVTDALTGCQIKQSFYMTEPPPMNLVLSTSSPTTCAGTSVTLTAVNSGGTPFSTGPAYTYSWSSGPATSTRTVNQPIANNYVYTLTSKDSYSCPITGTIAVDFIQNPVLSVNHVSICPLQVGTLSVTGASSYTWSNNSVGSTFADSPLSSQQYSVVGSALGCSSIATASIVVKALPVPLINSNSPVCNGQNLNLQGFGGVSFSWSGPLGYSSSLQYPIVNAAAPGNSGVYGLTVTSVNSCTSSTTKTLTVNPTPTLSAQGSTVCVTQALNLYAGSVAGATYTWSGPLGYSSNLQNPTLNLPPVGSSGVYTVKVTSPVGCTNTAVADVTVTALPVPVITSNSPKCFGSTLNFSGSGGVSYLWTGPNAFNSALQNPIITNVNLLSAGIYNLQVTTGPCVVNKTHTVVIHPLPSFTLNSNNPCETKVLSFSVTAVNNASVYSWQGPAGYSSPNQNPSINNVNQFNAGVYSLKVTDVNTCQNTATVLATIRENPTLTATGATVCLKQPAILKAEGADSYLWLGPDFYQSNQANALIASALSPVTNVYTVVGTAVNECTSVVTASLSTLSLPLPSLFISPGPTVCLNKAVSLEGFGGSYYWWNGPGNFTNAQKICTFTASSKSYEGTYTLIVTDAKGCSDYTTTAIYLDPLPSGSLLGSVMDACVPFRSDFSYYSSQPNAHIKTQWLFNDGFTSQTKNFSRSFSKPGDYIISATFIDTLNTCSNTSTYTVHARPIPVADFSHSPEKPIEGLEEVIFTNASSGEQINKWNWYFISNEGMVSEQKNSSYFFKNAGIYPVAMVIENIWGCSDSVVKAITVVEDFNVYVPDAFTPNGDNTNDLFLPLSAGVKLYELSVFNRWGKKMFQTSDVTLGWDGNFNGEPCKSEVYVWKIKVSSLSGQMKELSGHVTLYR